MYHRAATGSMGVSPVADALSKVFSTTFHLTARWIKQPVHVYTSPIASQAIHSRTSTVHFPHISFNSIHFSFNVVQSSLGRTTNHSLHVRP